MSKPVLLMPADAQWWRYREAQEGDTIPVIIGKKVYETVIVNGVQRFRENTALRYMHEHDNTGRKLNMHDGKDIHNCMFNLNTLIRAYYDGEFDLIDYMELVMPGYSVSGFAGLHPFNKLPLYNPLWDEDVVETTETRAIINGFESGVGDGDE